MEELREDRGAAALGLVLGYVALGVVVYSQLTGWDLVESLYFVIITLTSVGYGDYVPEGEALRLFTSAYIVLGVGILGTALGEVVSSLLSVDATPVGRLLAWLAGGEQTKGEGGEDGASPPFESSAEDLLAGSGDAQGNLLRTLATVAATIGVGSIAFQLLEPGVSWIDALYYSVVTVSTVGYGDYVPETDGARAFIIGYSLFGTVLLARSLGALAAVPLERRRRLQQQMVLDQYGGELDAYELVDLQKTLADLELCDLDRGYCTKSDFALAMLVRQDKCNARDVRMALGTFEKLDIDGSGELDEEDVRRWIEKQEAKEQQKKGQNNATK